MEGTYPLPEAQLDRFFFKLEVGFPSRSELHAILERTTGKEQPPAPRVLGKERILALRALARDVPVTHHVADYAIRLLEATHPENKSAPEKVRRFVRYGASPRGAQAMLLAAKIAALSAGRFAASTDDVRAVLKPALRHRVLLAFEGEAEGVKVDALLDEIVGKVPEAS
jgi:MoxR-like ATPase